jgi:methylmalonyl-CoA mutase N-terminal domain/subunit
MQICAEETGVADTVDPLAGSYFVEALTNEMEAKIREEIARVDRLGGVIEAIKTGAIQAEVARQAYRFEQMMLSGEYPKVAVNRHVAPDAEREASQQMESSLELYAFDPKAAEAQVAKLARLRRERDSAAVERALGRLRDTARGQDNLMPPILEAVRAYATLGEMAGVLREVWGEHKEPLVF